MKTVGVGMLNGYEASHHGPRPGCVKPFLYGWHQIKLDLIPSLGIFWIEHPSPLGANRRRHSFIGLARPAFLHVLHTPTGGSEGPKAEGKRSPVQFVGGGWKRGHGVGMLNGYEASHHAAPGTGVKSS